MARATALPILTAEPGLTHYFEEIRRFPMLERQEEYMLAALRYSVSIRAWAHTKLIRQIVLTVTKLKSSNAAFHATSTDTAHAQDFDLLRYSSQRWRSQCVSIDATTSGISARWHGGDYRGPSSITSMARRTMRSRIGEIPKPTSGAIWCPTSSRVSKASTCR